MKKLIAVLAIAGAMTACNNADTKTTAVDSPKATVDTTKKPAMDTAPKAAVDTTKKAPVKK